MTTVHIVLLSVRWNKELNWIEFLKIKKANEYISQDFHRIQISLTQVFTRTHLWTIPETTGVAAADKDVEPAEGVRSAGLGALLEAADVEDGPGHEAGLLAVGGVAGGRQQEVVTVLNIEFFLKLNFGNKVSQTQDWNNRPTESIRWQKWSSHDFAITFRYVPA